MNQTRLGSLIETVANTAIGFGVAIVSQLLVFPMFGIHVPLSANFGIGAWFTAISIARGYVLRRWFNARLQRQAQRIAARMAQGGGHG